MEGFLDPEKVLDEIGLKSKMIVAEFGSGSGSFAIPLAKRVADGLVYAIDIQKDPLSVLKSRANFENIRNIRIISSDLEAERGSTLADSSVDAVLIVNVLFQAEKKEVLIKEAKRILRNNGILAVIDWQIKASQGPEKGKISPERVKKIAEELSFKTEKEFEAGKYHYGLLFTTSK